MVTIVHEDLAYPFDVNQAFLEKFLRKQQVPEEILQSLIVVIQRHPEHFWNILWLPDGQHFKDDRLVVVYTNWIAEDVHWEAFRERHERLPFWLILALFSFHRLVSTKYRQPITFDQLRRKQIKAILTYINKVLLHELNHFMVAQLTPEEWQQMTYDEREELALAFEESHQSIRLIEMSK